jgi:hypothetical protein
MNNSTLKQNLIFLLLTILLSCSPGATNDQKFKQENSETKAEPQKKQSGEDPEVLLAIIQEGINPPSEILVERFGEILNSLKSIYTEIPTKQMADQLAKAYDVVGEMGNDESLLEFTEGFQNGVKNSINSNVRFDFTELIANYACYKTSCNNGNNDVLKFFDPNYTTPSRKSQYEGGDFVLIEDVEIFKKRFNSFMKEVQSSLRVRQVKFHDGKPTEPGKAFEYAFSNHLYVIGGLNKNGTSLRSLSIILEITDSPNDIPNFIAATQGAIASTDPDLKPEERSDILFEVGLSDPKRINSKDSWTDKTVKNGIQYNLAFILEVGYVFNAEKPSE